MPALLVSVRSPEEARAAVAGGAAVIDVKEPDRGPLGRAESEVWRAVREVVPRRVPMSVALGELVEWENQEAPGPSAFAGIDYRKLGLAGAGPNWAEAWGRLRSALGEGPAWVAVVYADWGRASAPHPDRALEVALATKCAGVLIDTWDKSQPSPVDLSWIPWVHSAQQGGLFVALAGGLDVAGIERLAPLSPDLFAVRASACAGADRLGTIETKRVARLARAVRRAQVAVKRALWVGC